MPAANPLSPIVVFVHGGWWKKQVRECEAEGDMLKLQAQGIAVVDINYPQAKPPFAAEDEAVATAVEWAHLSAVNYNGDPERLILFGGSAGGQLASVVGEQLAGTVKG
jgi:acetyl esterase/lipase